LPKKKWLKEKLSEVSLQYLRKKIFFSKLLTFSACETTSTNTHANPACPRGGRRGNRCRTHRGLRFGRRKDVEDVEEGEENR